MYVFNIVNPVLRFINDIDPRLRQKGKEEIIKPIKSLKLFKIL